MNWKLKVAPIPSRMRISFATARSRLNVPKPRRTPVPPPLVSTPRISRRNPEYTALGLANKLIPEPPLDALPDEPAPVETVL